MQVIDFLDREPNPERNILLHVPLHVNTYTLITVETIVIFPHLWFNLKLFNQLVKSKYHFFKLQVSI